ncbi:hypothetical protein [Fibrella forsythiae]|uniref:DUF4469 domain-containing protein n=1 Tax=Fibrella forsythiae TaxID=2817061 RepID=A0ABS3JBX5_9BACT|nr:hypothetical protein [Fibrella forsythiae]MBO0947501.1 hypothetical protein [Fibrella forsythiae]
MEVLLRLMYCATPDLTQATQLGSDKPIDAETAFGDEVDYQQGAHLELAFTTDPQASGTYVLVAPPYLQRTLHPTVPDKKQVIMHLYVTRLEQWPLFDSQPLVWIRKLRATS